LSAVGFVVDLGIGDEEAMARLGEIQKEEGEV
jgi:hypothetical protein